MKKTDVLGSNVDEFTREAYSKTATHFRIEVFQVTRGLIREARRLGVHDVPERRIASFVLRGRRLIRGPHATPLEAIPEGYAVHRITTGPAGQSIQARPAPDPDEVGSLIPEGHVEAGRSTMIDGAGNVLAQWVKTREGRDDTAIWERLIRDFDGHIPTADPVDAPTDLLDSILAVYPIGDPHLGLRNREGHDLAEGARLLMAAVSDLVVRGPRARECLIANLGDYFHSDDPNNRTRRGGNPLEVDGDWFEILKIGRDVFVHLIQRALAHHEIVNVKCLIGNHDDLSAVFLTLLIEAHFREEPRVVIDTSAAPFQWFEWGSNLLGFTHGQECKPSNLATYMANAKREAWGRTRQRYWYVGHVHHTRKIEDGGVVIEHFRTLSPKDAWHTAHGYMAGRDLTRIVLHREHGEVSRETVSAGMLA